jgi:Prolipoprotein diacylglyceryl transferase
MRWGRALAFYLVWYGIGRAWLESIRIDPSETFLGIRTNIWAALGAVALGIILWLWSHRRHTGIEVSVYLPGRRSPSAGLESEQGEPARYHVGKGASSDVSASSRGGRA